MESRFYLNGEIDKAAHPILTRLGASYAKPDLLVHQPGYMSGNHAVIEVKSSRPTLAGIRKDVNTLSLFRTKVGYQRAIYLVYGEWATEVLAKKILEIVTTTGNAPIELWLHQEATFSAVLFA
jgi:hypothetical protein